VAERGLCSRLHKGERAVAEPFSLKTQQLIDAADRAIAHSRALADQRRQLMAECKANRRVPEARFAILCETAKPE
jgi:hypothetical protein